ncbi:RHS repeat-associated core domain-containing protein [Lacibacter sp.]|uniref:RHS repeat-associated core domain-containing protein n=1 Tax=Lacibacter sp. TaxID=1915409 RepID=UPI002B4B755E|nr:RHS repeat-associated core domain-containing protein [Lacibacter sp.]HLP39530.1 RHS repeat-associated core domain-containing protein [Lacibacter sp.]
MSKRLFHMAMKKNILLLLLSVQFFWAKAADESYVQSMTGAIKANDSCTVIDDKFLNLPLNQWNLINNLSVNNYITFELRQDTNIYYYNKSFTCTLNLSIKYYSSRDQQTPTEINNISLAVKYDTASGKAYAIYDRYAFKNAYKVTVVVNSISSQEWGANLPAVFRITNQISVQRKYPFTPIVNAPLGLSLSESGSSTSQQGGEMFSTLSIDPEPPSNNRLIINWDPSDFTGYPNGFAIPEEYDFEWTHVDALDERAGAFSNNTITSSQVEDLMRFDNSRVTITGSSYTINLAYPDGFIVVRVRGVWTDPVTKMRRTTNWQYLNETGAVAFTGIALHEQTLNWQYNVSYAEEGKRKEVMSYFDGSFRNRQSVTINNSDNVAVVAENVYDQMGRPTLSILPAPVNSNILQYYKAINQNSAGAPYSYTDINLPSANNCNINASPLNTGSMGAAQYYSPQNAFFQQNGQNIYSFGYIPNAEGKPFALTQYKSDNTGRIQLQGGVGPTFQPGVADANGQSHETQYYYGKPMQSELYRIFGAEVGNASHYLKNLVIDPNGQVSVSYVDAAGKTIATALAGIAPGNTDPLASSTAPGAEQTKTDVLMKPADFQADAGSYIKEATASFLPPVKGANYTIQYAVDPVSFGPWNALVQGQQFCSNCYYSIEVLVKDDCGTTVGTASSTAFQANDVVCGNTTAFTGSLSFFVARIGEYHISYKLKLSEDVIRYQTDYYIKNNRDLKDIQHFFEKELLTAELAGCFTDCEACKNLPTLAVFTQKVKDQIQQIRDEKYPVSLYPDFDINSTAINQWITNQYNSIVANCVTINQNCTPSPCEEKLEMIKHDVRPGGQYATFSTDANGVHSYLEGAINVLRFYNLNLPDNQEIYNISFIDDNGFTVYIRNLSVSEFIAAYLKHPEWADAFSKKHIEYCSYEWCKDAGQTNRDYSNEASYIFDEKLKKEISTGQQAVNAGYFVNPASGGSTDYLWLSNADKFFNGGKGTGYKTQLQTDLTNLSTIMKMNVKDLNGNNLPAKNISQLVDWILYCRPTNDNATQQDLINSWTCTPDVACRSLTMEWELYRNYYLQIKSKYVRLAKQATNPACLDCFIGNDPLAANICEDPGVLTDYTVAGTGNEKWVEYKNGTVPFKGNYSIKLLYTVGANVHTYTLTTKKGDVKINTPKPVLQNGTEDPNPSFTIVSVKCLSGASQAACNSSSGGSVTCPTSSQFSYVYDLLYDNCPSGSCGSYYDDVQDRSDDIYYVHTSGPVAVPVTLTVDIYEVSLDPNYSSSYNCPTRTIQTLQGTFQVTIPAGSDRALLGNQTVNYSLNLQTGCYNSFSNYYIYTVRTNAITCQSSCPPSSAFQMNYGEATTSYFSCPGSQNLDQYITRTPVYLTHVNGPVQTNLTFNVLRTIFYPNGTSYQETSSIVLPAGQSSVYVGDNTYEFVDLNGNCIEDRGENIRSRYIVNTSSLSCSGSTPTITPPSSCPSDPLYLLYGSKQRIFNEYVDMDSYIQCNNANLPQTQAEIDALKAAGTARLRQIALDDLPNLKTEWENRLKSVRDEEFPSYKTTEFDAVIENLVNQLGIVAQKHIETAPETNIRAASTLPAGVTANNGYNNFEQVFTAIIGTTLVQQGFGAHLLDQPYPHDRTPVMLNSTIGEISASTRTAITTLKNRWIAAGGPGTFYDYLKNELKDDFVLTQAELTDLETRAAGTCRYTREYITLPTAFSPVPANNSGYTAWVTCGTVTGLRNNFQATYPNVTAGTKLYRKLFANYMNSKLGYTLTVDDYEEFLNVTCAANSNAVLYNRAASPLITAELDIICMDGVLRNVFNNAGQQFEWYITEERTKFRNGYISKCLSANASAKLQGKQYEYHYTLYYYDQSGNLVKTIPPEGVALLSDDEIALVEEFKDFVTPSCSPSAVNPDTQGNANATFTAFSTSVASNTTRSAEMWLYNGTAGNSTRHVRIVTPDKKYFYQAAIHEGKLWVEMYSLQESGVTGEVEIVLSNQAVAPITSSLGVQSWSHVFIQSANGLANGELQLYLDGRKLINLTGTAASPYPFEWEIEANTGSYTLPGQLLADLKHFRIYNRVASDAEVLANYYNSCLAPVNGLAVRTPLQYWGRFNVPAPGTATTTGPGSTDEYVNRFIVPDHTLATTYFYNSLNQVVKQNTPDAGTSEFWYDRLGRLVFSQNAEQKSPLVVNAENPNNRFSYTKYDPLGRIIRVGEKTGAPALTEDNIRDNAFVDGWYNSGTDRQVTVTAYDEQPVWTPTQLQYGQTNLRKRVVATTIIPASFQANDLANALLNSRQAASYYSYDIIGNVYTLVQENKALAAAEPAGGGFKEIKYEYDLVSGKVNKVLYQDGKWDQFYYQYRYDAENRLIKAYSSRINYSSVSDWVTEAGYTYYLHGPLARMELGNKKVQGVDYAYTLQGWLKGVNGVRLSPEGDGGDMSKDGLPGSNSVYDSHARDAYAFSLGYYTGDYSPIGGSNAKAFNVQYTAPGFDPTGGVRTLETGKSLYNGNISYATYAMKPLESGSTVGYTYRYDQLNRLTGMRRNTIAGTGTGWNNSGIIDAYKEEIAYDANGNIKTYLRNGAGSQPVMDILNYDYNYNSKNKLVNNKLRRVRDDNTAAANYTEDIDDQTNPDNYQYDRIGNLVADDAENLDRINWTVYGKIASIRKTNRSISYSYDAGGNRIGKTIGIDNGPVTTTIYVRDAQGNVLGVYEHENNNTSGITYAWREQHLYGSSRLGMFTPGVEYNDANAVYNPVGTDPVNNGVEGLRAYELSNHLGNVMVTISDHKIAVPVTGNGSLTDYFVAEVLSANDYYPFGMQMPGRKFVSGAYRYGFNGKENDDEVKGEGNFQDYGLRFYDSRLGRFLSFDPLAASYPFYTPYQFAGNMPIKFIDLDGGEPKDPGKSVGEKQTGTNAGNDVADTWTWSGSKWERGVTNSEVIVTGRSNKRKTETTSSSQTPTIQYAEINDILLDRTTSSLQKLERLKATEFKYSFKMGDGTIGTRINSNYVDDIRNGYNIDGKILRKQLIKGITEALSDVFTFIDAGNLALSQENGELSVPYIGGVTEMYVHNYVLDIDKTHFDAAFKQGYLHTARIMASGVGTRSGLIGVYTSKEVMYSILANGGLDFRIHKVTSFVGNDKYPDNPINPETGKKFDFFILIPAKNSGRNTNFGVLPIK